MSVKTNLADPAGSALHHSVTSFRLKKALTDRRQCGASPPSRSRASDAPRKMKPGVTTGMSQGNKKSDMRNPSSQGNVGPGTNQAGSLGQ